MSRLFKSIFVAALAATTFLPVVATAQLGSPNPLPGAQETVAIRNARIVPVSGPAIANGTIVARSTKIEGTRTAETSTRKGICFCGGRQKI